MQNAWAKGSATKRQGVPPSRSNPTGESPSRGRPPAFRKEAVYLEACWLTESLTTRVRMSAALTVLFHCTLSKAVDTTYLGGAFSRVARGSPGSVTCNQ